MALKPCPLCKEEIEADSIFCDQCGSELRKCTNCGGFCKGNFCPKCGKPSVKASEYVAPADEIKRVESETPSQQPSSSIPASSLPSSSSSSPVAVNPARPTTLPENDTNVSIPQSPPVPTRMVCKEYGISLPLQSGGVIGRVAGNYSHLLGACQYISGTHARIDFNGRDWTIIDLGSRNGTTVNGMPVGGMPVVLHPGAIVQLARTYNFIIE